jgi:beta-lactamase class D
VKRVFWALLCVAVINVGLMTSVSSADFVVREDFKQCFEGFTGTFIMYDETNDRYIVFNEPQSVKRLSPCSTFKIYNSLIGLETDVLDKEDVYTLYKWNGTQ